MEGTIREGFKDMKIKGIADMYRIEGIADMYRMEGFAEYLNI